MSSILHHLIKEAFVNNFSNCQDTNQQNLLTIIHSKKNQDSLSIPPQVLGLSI